MKAIFMIKFCVALLLMAVPDGVRTEELIDTLNRMADDLEEINRVLQPSVDGSLGSGGFSIVYRGKFLPIDNLEVAMKFWEYPIEAAQDEYRIYTYLNAISDPDIEDYGIPKIYYYGTWERYKVMAITLLYPDFETKLNPEDVKELDLLLLFREFVRIIKYVHSLGLVKRNTDADNMMIQNGQGFMISFHDTWMMIEDHDGLDEYENRISENIEMAKYDFEMFLNSVLWLFRDNLPAPSWHWLGLSKNRDAHRMQNCRTFSDELAKDARRMKRRGEQSSSSGLSSSTGLKRVFAEFLKHALDEESTSVMDANGDWIPFYDHLYRVVNEEIDPSSNSFLPHRPDPFNMTVWDRPRVKYHLFERKYANFGRS